MFMISRSLNALFGDSQELRFCGNEDRSTYGGHKALSHCFCSWTNSHTPMTEVREPEIRAHAGELSWRVQNQWQSNALPQESLITCIRLPGSRLRSFYCLAALFLAWFWDQIMPPICRVSFLFQFAFLIYCFLSTSHVKSEWTLP
jgi:hypothetical protein